MRFSFCIFILDIRANTGLAPTLCFYIIVDICEKVVVILVSPIATNGTIKYPTNKHTIGANPTTFPIAPFLFISLSFASFLFS